MASSLTRYDYFYDGQIKRYLLQVVRAFSGFQYATGSRGNTPSQLMMVPCIAATRSRQVAAVKRNMSENTLLSVPMISVDITDFQPDREALQNPGHVDTLHFHERGKNPITGEYTGEPGNKMTVERLMPRPYIITAQIDIWTANMDQKHQLLEQIDYIVMPGFDIQNSDNALDWSAITHATFESQTWSSVSLPIGTENEIDIATIVMKIPMWLTPPARVSRQTLIHQVITNVRDATKDENGIIVPNDMLIQHVTSIGNHHLKVAGNNLTLLGPHGAEHDDNGELYSWDELLNRYGTQLYPSQTQIRLRSTVNDDTSRDIIGVIQPTSEPNVVRWQPDLDTLPANTLSPVNAIINPLTTFPGQNIPAVSEGQRYLISDDLAGPSQAWGGFSARANSIIQYSNGQWTLVFDPMTHVEEEYMVNSTSGNQLKWDVDSTQWVMAVGGQYSPGYWRIGVIGSSFN